MTAPEDMIRTENLKSENHVSHAVINHMEHLITYKDPTGTSKAV